MEDNIYIMQKKSWRSEYEKDLNFNGYDSIFPLVVICSEGR